MWKHVIRKQESGMARETVSELKNIPYAGAEAILLVEEGLFFLVEFEGAFFPFALRRWGARWRMLSAWKR